MSYFADIDPVPVVNFPYYAMECVGFYQDSGVIFAGNARAKEFV